MEDFRVKMDGRVTMIESEKNSFKMSVQKDGQVSTDRNTALMDAVLYKEQGSFIKDCSYLFEALDGDNKPVAEANIDVFKNAINFFFTSILGTDYYIKSIPKESSLCAKELKEFQFDVR